MTRRAWLSALVAWLLFGLPLWLGLAWLLREWGLLP